MSSEPRDGPSSEIDPDAAIMLRVGDGDEAAFAGLVERYHQEVMNLGWRYFRDRQLAEDVAQETFLRVYRARKRYRAEAKFRTWLLRIATNLCISQLRKKRVSAHSLTAGDDEQQRDVHDGAAADPAAAPELVEMQRRVREAVERLPERQRVAILLSRFHGMTYPELEEALELSRPALKSLLHRARESLRKELEAYMAADLPGVES